MKFSLGITVPSLQRELFFNEITTSQHRVVIKNILNRNYRDLVMCFNQLLDDNCEDHDISKKINIFDKYYLLVTLRLVSIGPEVDFIAKCPKTEKNFEFAYNLVELANRMESVGSQFYKTVKVRDFTLNMSYPPWDLNSCKEGIDHSEFLRSVEHKGKVYDFDNKSEHERVEQFKKLPYFLVSEVISYVRQEEDKMRSLCFLDVCSPHAEDSRVTYRLSFVKDDIIDQLCLLFGNDLVGLYKSIYNISKLLNMSPEYIDSITPAERTLYWSFYIAEVNEKNKKAQQNQR